MPEFKLPDVGEGLTEAEVVAWHVEVGDVVEVNDPIVDIETAKSVVELPSPFAGEVTALLVDVGVTVEVGTPIIRIGESAAAPAAASAAAPVPESEPEPALAPEPAPAPVEEEHKTLVGYGPRAAGTMRRPRRATGSMAVAAASVGVLAKPPVRKLAADLGVDLATVPPTGPHGTVSREDVERAAAPAPAPAAVAPVEVSGTERRQPVKGLGKTMAQAMVASAFTAPHVTIWTTVDATATTRLLDGLRGRAPYAGLRLSPLVVAARAVTLALRRSPLLNARYDAGTAPDGGDEVVLRDEVNLGIAAATPRGLVVPNVKGAERMSLAELAGAIGELTATAREGRTAPADQAGGTFTITNVGPLGMEGGTPIINPGESAILCLGAVQRRPWVVGEGAEERLEARDVVTLTLSFDHRHIDGATGAAFLHDVAQVLADPVNALLV
ncbi:2-oxoisovalerate dehydrogenase E2 component (dihydrolipoyl transacylase) [Nocardioides zeae]|uniref:2-oxoisovalerate dehydrogenase E2 component (Dihydrolipoyl transacylase) n=1 Tax=Nocardioides zeae TaxID=1457234 RepID=A0ACC6ILL3_9ACTN|nr:dihydrolipoamide acetyltransferase family protein [Nocardioides zeae]MDR6173889.1 2-oxoisovalerate dehydrogenase E2 component (dihydrolipoyl transacylase) [Nocardioides zeae]MDR6211555.1 2-oxoisovalerate dehydrogenase E2 component (dihydrolipoyl transacylase) [Nocardioides zeae]